MLIPSRKIVRAPGFFNAATVGPVGGQASMVQLWNPAASGVVLYLDACLARVAVATGFLLQRHNAALANLAGTQGQNKRIGGAAPAAELRSAANATISGTQIWCWQQVATAGHHKLEWRIPVEIPAGWGVLIGCQTVNTGFDAAFEWREVIE